MKSVFEGVGVAIVTPFNKNKVDYSSLENLINHCLQNKVDAIVVLGTTGESCTVSFAERTKIIKFCKEKINNKAKLIVGTGSNNYALCQKYTKQAKLLGADAALVVTPYYNKTTQQGLVEYYKNLSTINIPLIMYNVPTRTGLNLELSTIKEIISTNPMIYGIKECTNDTSRIINLMKICNNKIAVYSGEDVLNYVFYFLNGYGTISVTANLLPQQVGLVYKLAKNKEFSKALELQNSLAEINSALFCETNPIPIKYALYKKGIISSPQTRPPLVNLSKENKTKIDEIIKSF